MSDSTFFHSGNRHLQDEFASRRISDRLESFTRSAFTADDQAFIEGAIYFFIATADAEGRPDCSFKGGRAGLRARNGRRANWRFPDYDGNGMFKSLGNLLVNTERRAAVHCHARAAAPPARQRHGQRIARRPPACPNGRRAAHGARRRPLAIFPNCPRYIPKLEFVEPSVYVPQPGCDPVEPGWKTFHDFKDVVHPRQPTCTRRGYRREMAQSDTSLEAPS